MARRADRAASRVELEQPTTVSNVGGDGTAGTNGGQNAILTGPHAIRIGKNAVIHPGALLDSTNGP